MHLIEKETSMSTKVQIPIGSIFVVQFYHFFYIRFFNQGIAYSIFFHVF